MAAHVSAKKESVDIISLLYSKPGKADIAPAVLL
jgi:hypothetical protein